MVVVVGVDVVVVLLVSHVLLVAQLAVESGVSFLLHEEMERQEEEVKENSLCAFAVILSHCTINKIYGLSFSVYNISSTKIIPRFFSKLLFCFNIICPQTSDKLLFFLLRT